MLFLDEILLCLPVLGINHFTKIDQIKSIQQETLFLKGDGSSAEGCEDADGFTVFSGAKARARETSSFHKYMADLRLNLIEREVLKKNGDDLTLTQDYCFSSPSTAAAIILGRNANGRTEWKNSKGKTLKELQEQGF